MVKDNIFYYRNMSGEIVIINLTNGAKCCWVPCSGGICMDPIFKEDLEKAKEEGINLETIPKPKLSSAEINMFIKFGYEFLDSL